MVKWSNGHWSKAFQTKTSKILNYLKGPFTYLGNLRVNQIAYSFVLVLLFKDNCGLRKSQFIIQNPNTKI